MTWRAFLALLAAEIGSSLAQSEDRDFRTMAQAQQILENIDIAHFETCATFEGDEANLCKAARFA